MRKKGSSGFSSQFSSSQRSKTQNKPSIEEMFQALAKKIRRQQGQDSQIDLLIRDTKTPEQVREARTLRIEKEKQVGVLLSQLSKKFPISDVLEKKNIDELDEELAVSIQNRVDHLRYFQMEGLPFSKASSIPSNTAKVQNETFSRNPNLMSTFSSKDNQLSSGADIILQNKTIFGKLKHKDQKIPSTAMDKEKNSHVIIQKKKLAKSINNYSFINPNKIQYFKSQYNPRKAPPTPNGAGLETTKYEYDWQQLQTPPDEQAQNQAYYQPSFKGLVPDHIEKQSSIIGENTMRQSQSILRNNPDDSYIMRLADANRDSTQMYNHSKERGSASFIFNDEYENEGRNQLMNQQKQPTFEREDGSLVYYQNDIRMRDTSINIQLGKSNVLMRKSSNNPDLRQYIPIGAPSLSLRPHFRAQTTQSGAQRRRQTTTTAAPPSMRLHDHVLPSLTDIVKMPKRLLNKAGVETTDNRPLYNQCPQAAFLDKEMSERLSPAAMRKSLISVRKDMKTNELQLVRKQSNEQKAIKLNRRLKSIREASNYQLRRDNTIQGSDSNNDHRIKIDPVKVKDAMDKIYEITRKNKKEDQPDFKLEYSSKPIKYDFIDPEKMNFIERKKHMLGKYSDNSLIESHSFENL